MCGGSERAGDIREAFGEMLTELADDRMLSSGDGGRRSSGSSAIAAERSIGLHWFSAACGERLLETARLPWEEPRLRGRPARSPEADPGRRSVSAGLDAVAGLDRAGAAYASLALHGLEAGSVSGAFSPKGCSMRSVGAGDSAAAGGASGDSKPNAQPMTC